MKLLNTIAIVVTALSVQAVVAAEAVIPYTEAAKYYTQTKTVEGTIVGTHCDEKRCFLNFHEDYRNNLSAVIDTADIAKFSKATGKAAKADMDKMYAGKKVQITGMLTEYKSSKDGKGRPQIYLTDSKNIKVVVK
jgi:hypothetical protein